MVKSQESESIVFRKSNIKSLESPQKVLRESNKRSLESQKKIVFIFMLIPAFSCLFLPIPAYSCLFQPIPAYSSVFRPIPASSGSYIDCLPIPRAIEHGLVILTSLMMAYNPTNKQHSQYRAIPDLLINGWTGKNWKIWSLE